MELGVSQLLYLDKLIDETFPGLSKLLSHGSRDFSRDKLSDFIEVFRHAEMVCQMSEDSFSKAYGKWAKAKGYRMSTFKATQIFTFANTGIPWAAFDHPMTKDSVLRAVHLLHETNRTLNAVLSRMIELAQQSKEYRVAIEFPGIGKRLAVRIVGEPGDWSKFSKGKCLIAFAGIDTPPFESGDFKGTNRHISKRGSAILRKVGYQAMKCIKAAKSPDCPVYTFMVKKELEGKPKKVAKIAGLNKFLRILYARVSEVA